MSRHAWSFLPLLWACTGQVTEPPPPVTDPDVDTDDETDPPDTPAPDTGTPSPTPPQAQVLQEDQLLVQLPAAGACPAPDRSGWQGAPLFATSPAGNLRGPLARYCMYRRTMGAELTPFSAVPAPSLDTLLLGPAEGFPEGTRAISGRAILGGASVDVEQVRLAWHHALLDDGGFLADTAGPFSVVGLPPEHRTRVALIDTAADAASPWPTAPDALQIRPEDALHGYLLGHLIRDVACAGGPPCGVEIATYQAMRLTSADGALGAARGTLPDLADAIMRAVDDWFPTHHTGAFGGLVLNLSLAWHPYYGGGAPGGMEIAATGDPIDDTVGGEMTFSWDLVDPAQLPPDVAAVYDALGAARCYGAITFAAAGNATSGPSGTDGPLLPAAWDAIPVPRYPDCASIEAPLSAETSHSLVYAVGAVDATGADLATSRPGSRPTFVAYGDHALVEPDSLTLEETPIMTGTSVATALVSATAALYWARDPGAPVYKVPRYVAEYATESGDVSPAFRQAAQWRYAELGVDGVGKSRLVRPCAVMGLDWWSSEGWSCVTTPAHDLSALLDACPAETAPAWAAEPVIDARCGARTTWHPEGEPVTGEPCPDLVGWDPLTAPWTAPQPETAGCSDCVFDATTGVLHLSDLPAGSRLTLVLRGGEEVGFVLPAAWGSSVSLPMARLPAGLRDAALVEPRQGRVLRHPIAVAR